jgi:hypothetical protein
MDASKKQEKAKTAKKQPVKEADPEPVVETANDVDKEYGVAIVNPFDLLSEDGPKPAPKKKEEPKEDKKKKQDNKQKNAPRESNAELSTGTR